MGSGPIRSVHGCLAHEMGQVGVALAIKADDVIRARDLPAPPSSKPTTPPWTTPQTHGLRADGPQLVPRHWTRRRHHAARRFYERYADHAVAVARLHGVALASQGGPSGLVGL